MIIEIYFDDLNLDAKLKVLEACGISHPKEMNWDVYPLCAIEVEPSQKEDT